MLSGRMAKSWILVHASQLRAESDFCVLDVPGLSALIFLILNSRKQSWNIFLGMMLMNLWAILSSQVMQWRRRRSSLPHDRQLQSLPQRGAQESWNSSTGKWKKQKPFYVNDAAAFDVTVFLWEFGCCRVPDPCLPQICVCGKFAMWFSWWQGLSLSCFNYLTEGF